MRHGGQFGQGPAPGASTFEAQPLVMPTDVEAKFMGGGPPRPGAGGTIGDQTKIDIGNFKSALNETVMKVIQRPLGGEDILYNSSLVTMAGGMPLYKSTVRINALEGREFEGKPQSLRKSAEQAAAQVALSQLTSNFCSKPGGPLPGPSRSQAAKLPNYKGRLQELLVQEHTKARLFGGLAGECGPVEINYSTQATPSGEGGRPSASRFGSSVDVTTKNFKASFVGEVCKERKTAEQSAAYAALQHFLKQDSMIGVDIGAQPRPVGPSEGQGKPSAKSELNELIMKILSRPATVQDIVYGLRGQHGPPFKAFVAVPALAPGKEFDGEAQPQKKMAEQSAAGEALKHFKSLPEVPRPIPSARPAGSAAPGWSPLGSQLGAGGAPAALAADGTPLPVPIMNRRKAGGQAGGESIEAQNGNHKSALNEFVMKVVGRPLSGGDILYTVRSSRPGNFQATVKIPVIDGMEFQAAPRSRKRDAEQGAAQLALLCYQAKYPGLAGGPRPTDEAAVAALTAGVEGANGDGGDDSVSSSKNYKSALNELAMRTAGRPLAHGDIIYEVRTLAAGQFQAIAKPIVIDAELEFLGDVGLRKKDAEHLAAKKALEHFGNKAPSPAAPPRQPGTAPNNASDTSDPEGANFKSALNELVMRSCGRPLGRDDITYLQRPSSDDTLFLAAVKVSALDPDREFEGEARARKRDAEQMAAKVALDHFQSLAIDAPASAPPLLAPPVLG